MLFDIYENLTLEWIVVYSLWLLLLSHIKILQILILISLANKLCRVVDDRQLMG